MPCMACVHPFLQQRAAPQRASQRPNPSTYAPAAFCYALSSFVTRGSISPFLSQVDSSKHSTDRKSHCGDGANDDACNFAPAEIVSRIILRFLVGIVAADTKRSQRDGLGDGSRVGKGEAINLPTGDAHLLHKSGFKALQEARRRTKIFRLS
mmetsp:Transcript_1555/g.6787  ORF Transcript_1555/g.6787 Transcript_1555/m.6787 type:complete len:152 (+) Transcript_1555:409-864(+)